MARSHSWASPKPPARPRPVRHRPDHSWNGQTVDATCVLIKFTYAGDANLSGNIDADDYALIDFNHPSTAHGYYNGDFNYDGEINADDYALIDFNRVAQGGRCNPFAPLPPSYSKSCCDNSLWRGCLSPPLQW